MRLDTELLKDVLLFYQKYSRRINEDVEGIQEYRRTLGGGTEIPEIRYEKTSNDMDTSRPSFSEGRDAMKIV